MEETGRGVSEKVSAVGFCLGGGLFGSCNSNQRLLAKSWNHILNNHFFISLGPTGLLNTKEYKLFAYVYQLI